ncbi:hypothetical protein ACIHFB_34525 [Streptomyces sp. NPDC051963]
MLAGWLPNPLEQAPAAELTVEVADVRELAVEHTETSSATGEQTGKYPLRTPAVAVTLKNGGDLAAVITEARITFKQVRRLDPCDAVGGDLAVTGTYTYSVPSNVTAGARETVPVRFEVKPRRGDTLAITFGTEEPIYHSSPVWLYRVTLELKESDAEGFIPVPGEFSLASNSDMLGEFADRKCRDSIVNDFMAGRKAGDSGVTPTLREL